MNGDPAAAASDLSPSAPSDDTAPPLTSLEAVEGWEQRVRQATALLRQPEPDAAWLSQFVELLQGVRALAQRDMDAALYLLLQLGTPDSGRYSASHALLCAVVCELCAHGQGWPADEIDSLTSAAASMNLSMTALQDALVEQPTPPTPAQRTLIDSHAERSAALLEAAGVADPLWLQIVRLHHADGAGAAASPEPAPRLAELLRRVDIYTAKLSGRVGREARSPAIAARDTCLGADGKPDRVGSVLLRMLGLYPPGCFVQLANGDFGIVVKRGRKAHTPCVASLRREDGWMYNLPKRRPGGEAEHAVRHGVTRSAVNVRCDHVRILNAA